MAGKAEQPHKQKQQAGDKKGVNSADQQAGAGENKKGGYSNNKGGGGVQQGAVFIHNSSSFHGNKAAGLFYESALQQKLGGNSGKKTWLNTAWGYYTKLCRAQQEEEKKAVFASLHFETCKIAEHIHFYYNNLYNKMIEKYKIII